MTLDPKDAKVTGEFRGLDHTKVLGTCGRCGHRWMLKQQRITWAKEGGYKLLCDACKKRASAARHKSMAWRLTEQANVIDAKRAKKKAAKAVQP